MIRPLESEESIASRQKSQNRTDRHPLTCGNNRTDELHRKYQLEHSNEDFGKLIAVQGGWKCPVCDYFQNLWL